MRDDDDIWFDSLAGGKGDEPEKAARAARAIRAAILTRIAAEGSPTLDQNAQREGELIARARAEGLLPAARATRYRRLPALLAAAAIAGLAVTVTLRMRTEPTPVTRGSPAAVARIRAAHPKELQQQLIRELESAGVQARGYESFGRPAIDADLPSPLPSAVSEVLARHGITAPKDNVLQLEIDASTP
ncbi:MAG TPA: hypothetical protein VGI32_11820 [Steroidobacteraceae bacterium]|jgi:hypothetical protein